MTLAPGTRLGPYEITAKLGEGGMGEVWRATDSRLKREVAIKVLPAAFTADPERLARFEREAQLLAQLHHPNIASIFGLEESGGVRALVMELVEGPTLAERLEHEAVPLEEALPIARQIAEALEAAHEKGIVHRDLKPANIKLTGDGKVKVLDFGLAKALDPTAGASGSPSASPTLMNSPTLTAAGTQLGVILGTAAYMSPEQAKGVEVDKRADVWAFGVVLWEMLAGRRLFVGATVSETLAAVLRDPVDFGALPVATPPSARRLLARCLERNPRQRLRDIGEARFALDEAAAEPAAVAASPAATRSPWVRLLPWTAALLALAFAVWSLWGRGDAAPHDVTHLDLAFPPELEPVDTLAGAVDISPDGRVVAMIGATEGRRRLYLRRLDRARAIELSDPSGVNAVAFSPDSASVAILSGSSQITRVSLVDQQRVVLAPGADLDSSLAWGTSGICFQRDGELWLVPATGGNPRQLTRLDAARHEVVHADPLVLPDGRTVLFSSRSSAPGGDRIEAVSVADGARSTVVDNAIGPLWSSTGHLLFARDGSLLAAPFDPRQPTRIGAALPVIAAGEVGTLRWGSLALRLSATGNLLAVPPTFNFKRLLSVERDGVERALDLPAASWSIPRVSPDGRRLLLAKTGSTVEALDLVRGTTTQLAAATFATSFPAWTADGHYAAFRRGGVPYWVAADGSGRLGVFPGATLNDYPCSPGPDADLELMVRIQAVTGGDVYLLSLSGRAPPRPVLASPAYEGGPQLSSDRAWLVYQSNESGRPEIYVRRFPAVDRAWQISEGGGIQPRWRADGKEIYYRGGGKIVAVSFDGSSSEPGLGKPTALFTDDFDIGPGLSSPNYDVTPDGKFLFFRRTPTGGRLQVVLNWTDELKRIIAAGGVR